MEQSLLFFILAAVGFAVFGITIGIIASDPSVVTPSNQPPGPNDLSGDGVVDGLYLGSSSSVSDINNATMPGSGLR